MSKLEKNIDKIRVNGEKRILEASQGRSTTVRGGVERFFSRKILVTKDA